MEVDASDLVVTLLNDKRLGVRRPGFALEVIGRHRSPLLRKRLIGSMYPTLRGRSGLCTSLTFALHEPLIRGDFTQTHGPACDRLLGRVDDLSAEAKLPTVRELGRGVYVDNGAVDLVGETLGGAVVLRDDGVRMPRAVLGD